MDSARTKAKAKISVGVGKANGQILVMSALGLGQRNFNKK
jgi:hypothetical protein